MCWIADRSLVGEESCFLVAVQEIKRWHDISTLAGVVLLRWLISVAILFLILSCDMASGDIMAPLRRQHSYRKSSRVAG